MCTPVLLLGISIILSFFTTQAYADWSTVLSTMSRQQRLTMLDLSSLTVGGYPGDLMDLGLGSMLESYLVPMESGSDRFYLKSAPHRQIIQVSESVPR